MDKKRVIKKLETLSTDLENLFESTYQDGYLDYLVKIPTPNGSNIFAVPLETEDTKYLIKVDLETIDEDVEEDDVDDFHEEDSFKDLPSPEDNDEDED